MVNTLTILNQFHKVCLPPGDAASTRRASLLIRLDNNLQQHGGYFIACRKAAIVNWVDYKIMKMRRRGMVKPGKIDWEYLRTYVFERDRYTCGYCGSKVNNLDEITCDHIIPKAAGGSSFPENLITACRNCNNTKGVKSVRKWKFNV